jgi:hypothetical protein
MDVQFSVSNGDLLDGETKSDLQADQKSFLVALLAITDGLQALGDPRSIGGDFGPVLRRMIQARGE